MKKIVQQLQMVWPQGKKAPHWRLPKGYSLRTYRPSDSARYIRLMKKAGFAVWDKKILQDLLQKCLPEGIFFAVHSRTKKLAATAAATHKPTALHPFGGELGWVAADPEHRGKGLGYIVSAAALQRFLSAGYKDIYLLTDDFRLSAIQAYLKLGFAPLLFRPDMKKRWRAVLKQLPAKNTIR